MKERSHGEFYYADAIRIAQQAYADAIREMTEEDILDDSVRDEVVNASIANAFMSRLPVD